MRRLRFGPRIPSKHTPYSAIISKEAATKSTSAVHAMVPSSQGTSRAAKDTFPDTSGPVRPSKGAQKARLEDSGSVTSGGHVSEGLESVSSLELDSFPIPPFNSTLTLSPGNGRAIRPAAEALASVSKPDAVHSHTKSQEASIYSPHAARQSQGASPSSKRILSPTLHALADGAASVVSGRLVSPVDSALVEAISRSVAEHLRMLSVSARSGKDSPSTPSTGGSRSVGKDSRTSSQREALKQFAKEILKYAEHTNAKGRVFQLTPSSRSPATLHTVSALMPYRGEFKAAGLAVTSRDQAGLQTTRDKNRSTRFNRRNAIESSGQPIRMSQVDGKEDAICEQYIDPSSSEVSFLAPSNVDKWRYALIDEVSQPRGRAGKKTPRKVDGLCIPCFPSIGSGRGSLVDNVKRSVPNGPGAPIVNAPSPAVAQPKFDRPSHIPLPPRRLDSAEPSPRHLCDGVGSLGLSKVASRTTGYRRPSMTIPQSLGHLESCSGSHIYTHPDEEIHRHNPRPTTTQYLHPSAAVRPQANTTKLSAVPAGSFASEPSRFGSRATTGVSLPDFPFSRNQERRAPLPLRRTLDHLPDRPREQGRVLTVRNPTEPVVEPVISSSAEKLFPGPQKPLKKRTSVSRKSASRRPVTRRIRPAIPLRASSILHSIRSTELDQPKRHVTDRDVLRGLHVATSAACDEEVDDYVREKTGLRIRQFLADLVALETYWSEVQSVDDDKEQRARQRRTRMRRLKQHMRRSRAAKAGSGQT